MTEKSKVKGVLVVNNLHMGLQRPALRFDEAYYEVVKNKLRKVFDIALKDHLRIVFTGVFTQKLWDTSVFSYLVEAFQSFEGEKPLIVLDEPCLLRDGTVKKNSICDVLSIVGVVDLLDQHTESVINISGANLQIVMIEPGKFSVIKLLDKPVTIIKSDDSIPSLVRTGLNEKDKPAAILKLTSAAVEEVIIDNGLAPIDDVAFDLADEIKTFDSELVERLHALMAKDAMEGEVEGDTDLRALCEEIGVSGEARKILFELKDEASAESF